MYGPILNIHGYRGSSKNSLYTALTNTGYEVYTVDLDYDKFHPTEIMSRLSYIIDKVGVRGIAGTSLGGFFALCCSAKYQLPALLVNPATTPELILPTLGYKNIAAPRSFLKVRAVLGDYNPGLITAIIGKDDEVITDEAIKKYTSAVLNSQRTISVPGGHSGSTLPLTELLLNSELLKEGRWLDVKDYLDDTLS